MYFSLIHSSEFVQTHINATGTQYLPKFSVSLRIQALILVNNKITIIHAKAFVPLVNLERLYLSKNMLKEIPSNMPKSVQELRIHENQITKIKKASFTGMVNVIVMGKMGSSSQRFFQMFALSELCLLKLHRLYLAPYGFLKV